VPFFLPLEQGDRFCILHRPDAAVCKGAILYIHPFAEELNRCRRMAALQARALRAAGWAVLQIDLFGCGDSAGEFVNATWLRWIEDVIEAARWLEGETGHAPALWGLRAGCLLATQAAPGLASSRLLLWQPVVSGRQFLQQFLRLRIGSQIVSNAGANVTVGELREALQAGRAVEVTGYTLSPGLASGLDAADLRPPDAAGAVIWLEVSAAPQAALLPASVTYVERWRAAGHSIDMRAVAGPPFWQTPEIAEAPELVRATLEAIQAWSK